MGLNKEAKELLGNVLFENWRIKILESSMITDSKDFSDHALDLLKENQGAREMLRSIAQQLDIDLNDFFATVIDAEAQDSQTPKLLK